MSSRSLVVIAGVALLVACAQGSDGADLGGDGGATSSLPTDPGADGGGGNGGNNGNGGDGGTNTPKDSGIDGSNAPVCATGAKLQVVINEVQAQGLNGNDEFVELYNGGDCKAQIGDWSLAYRSAKDAGGGTLGKLPAGTLIAPGQFIVFGTSSFKGTKDFVLTAGMAWDNGQLGLLDASKKVVDSIAYGTLDVTKGAYQEGTTAPSPPDGGSVGRKSDGSDTNDNGADFEGFTKSTPGAPNH